MKKLMNNKGETLIESMVAILIFTLSSIMLYTMLTTSVDLNKKAKEADAVYADQMIYAEQAEDPSGNCSVTFKLKTGDPSGDLELFEYDGVNLYRKEADALYSFSID